MKYIVYLFTIGKCEFEFAIVLKKDRFDITGIYRASLIAKTKYSLFVRAYFVEFET